MKNFLLSLLFFLAGTLVIIYNKLMAEDAIKVNAKLEAPWLRWKYDLWLARMVLMVCGVGIVIFGLAMALGYLDD